MKLPYQPGEEPEPKTNEQPRRNPKVIVHRGMAARDPGKTGWKLSSLFKRKPASHPVARSQVQVAPRPQPDHAADTETESPSQAKSQSTHPVRSSGQGVPPRSGKGINPGLRLRAFEVAAKNAPPARIPIKYRLRPNRELTRRAYWDVTTTFSLIVNAILVGLLFVMAGQIRNLKTTVNSLLGGLYSNFVKMDQASINTTITVDTQIPLNFNLPISQNTDVILTSAVFIPGARVTINSGALTIDNAPANVTLPLGTSLPIALNLNIPVQVTLPISLQVPVNIPLSQTELHEPFTGLQTTLRPLYCTFNKNAQYPEGIFICAEHDAPTPGTP